MTSPPLSPAKAAARMLIVGFDGTRPPAHLLDWISRYGLGGVILFSRNIEDPAQVAELVAQLRASASLVPPLVTVDQEGGRVERFREPLTRFPPMAVLGRHPPELSRAVGRVMARELGALGVGMNLAPVLDVDTNPDNPIIGDRSFSSDPELVLAHGCALARGLLEGGLGACGKHFPGHGDTSLDSHLDLPVVDLPLSRLRSVELHPFRGAVAMGIPAIMTAHVVYPCLDPLLPATLSARVIHDLLRRELGFPGVVMSDAMEMQAISDHFDLEESLLGGIEAGVDMFIICRPRELQERALETLTRLFEKGAVPRERLVASFGRIDALLERFALPASPLDRRELDAVIGAPEHRRLAEKLIRDR